MDNSVFRIVVLAQVASTLFMTGLIWFVQIVHYPLFAQTGRREFQNYERRHTSLTTWVVGPPMLIEGATSIVPFLFPQAATLSLRFSAGLALVVFIWLSTALVQVPCHNALSREFHPAVHRRLVASNWFRTVAWSLRGVLVLWTAFHTFR